MTEGSASWDAAWRRYLVENWEVMAQQLWQVGIRDSFADGSFAEDKDHPNDLDGYFVCSLDLLRTGELSRQLGLLDPDKVWTWGSGVAESLHWLSQAPTSYVASLSCGALRACAGAGCGQRDS